MFAREHIKLGKLWNYLFPSHTKKAFLAVRDNVKFSLIRNDGTKGEKGALTFPSHV